MKQPVSALREHLGYYETFSVVFPFVVQNLAQFDGIYWTYAYSCLEQLSYFIQDGAD
jgi:hypothetical protein